jgi:hypothetical protein
MPNSILVGDPTTRRVTHQLAACLLNSTSWIDKEDRLLPEHTTPALRSGLSVERRPQSISGALIVGPVGGNQEIAARQADDRPCSAAFA